MARVQLVGRARPEAIEAIEATVAESCSQRAVVGVTVVIVLDTEF